MNTPRTSLGRLFGALLLVTTLAGLTGCAAPRPGGLGPTSTAESPTLTVHRPAERTPKGLLSGIDASRFLARAGAPDKAKGLSDERSQSGALGEPTHAALETEPADAAEMVPGADMADTAPTAPSSCPPPGLRVLLVGDSLSAGLGPHMAARAHACGTPFFHRGVVGSHVTEWAEDTWLGSELARAEPHVVMVSLGGNDFVRHDRDNVARGIERFVKKVRTSGARVLWISPPTMPFADKVGARELWQAALGGEVGVDWFPTEKLDIPRVEDRVHPTVAGYSALSGVLFSWLASSAK